MKSLLAAVALFGVWMSVDSASIITPDTSIWPSNISMTEMQNECVNKISQDSDLMLEILNIKFTFLNIFIKMTQEIRRENSLDSLDSLVNNICYPALDEDKLYSLTMNVIRLCLNKIDNFTNEDKQLIKNKLGRAFCSVYMKLAGIITFSPDCLSNPTTLNEMSKCAQGKMDLDLDSEKSFRDWFFGDAEGCRKQSNALDCLNQAVRGHCTSAISEKVESTLYESRSIMGCESEPNSLNVINSL